MYSIELFALNAFRSSKTVVLIQVLLVGVAKNKKLCGHTTHRALSYHSSFSTVRTVQVSLFLLSLHLGSIFLTSDIRRFYTHIMPKPGQTFCKRTSAYRSRFFQVW